MKIKIISEAYASSLESSINNFILSDENIVIDSMQYRVAMNQYTTRHNVLITYSIIDSHKA